MAFLAQCIVERDESALATHSVPLVDSDVAVGEGSADGITVIKADRNRIRGSRMPVISHTHAKPDFGRVLQMTRASELGRVARDGETVNSGVCYADTGSGIAKCNMTELAAVIGLSCAKLERDFVPLVVDGAAAIDVCGDDSGIIKFGAREVVSGVPAAYDEHPAVGQQCRPVENPASIEATGEGPGSRGQIVEFRAREHLGPVVTPSYEHPPSGSNVAVWDQRAILRLPVTVQFPVAGS